MAPQALVSTGQERRSPTLVSVDGRTYPLRSAQIRARAEGGLAQSTLVQEFSNPHDDPLEVIYTMPLPADGAVLGYTIRMGERIIRGEIEVREKAEARFRQALYEGRTAGLLEEDRADTFQQRLGNLPPRTGVQVEIEVLHPLAFLAGGAGGEHAGAAEGPVSAAGPVWEYRFPTVVGVRYQGAGGRVVDADRLDVDRDQDGAIPTRFGLDLLVADDVILAGGIASASHEIVCVAVAEGVRVGLADDARLDRDLVLRWAAATGEVGVRVVEGRGHGSDDGRYALVTVTPPRVPNAAYQRDLTVLIDASGSMDGEPIELAKRVVEDLLKSLGSGDRFEVLEFATKPRGLTRGLEDVSEKSVRAAINAVRAIRADGGTEMWSAVDMALASLRRNSQRQIILVTDGQIGFEREVVAKMGSRLPSGVRVHAVGIGSAPNRSLTSSLARAGRGVELLVNDEVSADEAAGRLCAATARPVLTDLSFGGSALRAVAPAHPRDVFAGQPLVLAAELKAAGGTLEVKGRLAGSNEVWGWRIEVPAAGNAADAGAAATALATTPLPIGALYGREAIADLEASPDKHGGRSPDLDKRIETLGLRHRITSRRTSLVAIAEEPTVDPLAPRRRERLALELPAGVSAEGVGLMGEMYRTMRGMPGAAFRETGMDFLSAIRPSASRQMERGLRAKGMTERSAGREVSPPSQATLLRVDGDELTIELTVPHDGFVLPRGDVKALINGRKLVGAAVVMEQSTHAGPHQAGMLVRLTLRVEAGAKWPEKGTVTLIWEQPGPAPDEAQQFIVEVVMDAARDIRPHA